MEHIELIIKFITLGGFITLMMWLDRRFDLGLSDWDCGGRRRDSDEPDAEDLRARIASLEAVVADRDWQLDREFDVLQRGSR